MTCLLRKCEVAYSSRYVRSTSGAGLIVGAISGEGYDPKPCGFGIYDELCQTVSQNSLGKNFILVDGESAIRALTSVAVAPMTAKVKDCP